MSHLNKILAINPGATSTKIGLYEEESLIFKRTLEHSAQELDKSPSIFDQYSYRLELIMDILKEEAIDIATLTAIVGRGGLLKPLAGGTYEVNEAMVEDLKKGGKGGTCIKPGGCNGLQSWPTAQYPGLYSRSRFS